MRWILFFGAAMLVGALGGSLFGPAPAGAVAREIIELQTGVTQLIQGQQNMQTEITQNAAVQKTTQDFSAAWCAPGHDGHAGPRPFG